MWFKVDDSLHSHPKAMAASLEALGFWSVCGSWSGDHLTDGFVPDHVILTLSRGKAQLADELVAVGLWRRAKGGYRFHQWTERNPTKSDVAAAVEKKATGGALGNHLRWHAKKGKKVPTCPFCKESIDESLSVAPPIASGASEPADDEADSDAKQAEQIRNSGKGQGKRASHKGSDIRSVTDRSTDRIPNPDPTRPEGSTTYSNTGGFEEIWDALPRRKGDSKHKAEVAYNAAINRRVGHAAILEHAHAYARERHGQDPQFHKGAQAWFNTRPWENGEPEQPQRRSLWEN